MADIRPLTADDHAAWLPLWQDYQRFYNSRIPEAASALTWQRFLDPTEPMHAALAWRDGEAVGLVHWIFHRSCWTTGDYCYLQDLFVAQSIRGGGARLRRGRSGRRCAGALADAGNQLPGPHALRSHRRPFGLYPVPKVALGSVAVSSRAALLREMAPG